MRSQRFLPQSNPPQIDLSAYTSSKGQSHWAALSFWGCPFFLRDGKKTHNLSKCTSMALMRISGIEDIAYETLCGQGSDVPPPPWTELGQGVWGIVYDLGDGTVLKLVRKRGGLGTPAALIYREVETLKMLGGRRVGGFAIPELLDHGDLHLPSNPLFAPMEGFLRMTRLRGGTLAQNLPFQPEKRQQVAERFGAALADFHVEAARLIDMAHPAFTDPLVRAATQLKSALRSADDRRLAEEVLALWTARPAPAPVFLHGDMNLSNVLMAADGSFGLCDFGEAGIGIAHSEFRHFEERPEIRDVIFWGYQAASGAPIDLDTYYIAATVNALGSLFFGGAIQPGVASNDPRTGMRLRGMVRHCAKRAGFTVREPHEG